MLVEGILIVGRKEVLNEIVVGLVEAANISECLAGGFLIRLVL